MSEDDAKGLLKTNIRDLVGIRVLVYFPEDVPKVVQAINDASDLEIEDQVVSFTKSRVDRRKQDLEHQKNGADLNYSEGPWATVSVSLDDVELRWKHFGYRAVHMHVKLKSELPPDHGQSKNDEKLQHRANEIEVVPDSTEEEEPLDINVEALIGMTVEIQVTAVVMHAWSQVEHDVIYENPHKLPITATMTRMLDSSINGLAITSEIMLQELQRGPKCHTG
jgi:ppGpp synthetase/RelA/SpoT-type nucleotidyltranferase